VQRVVPREIFGIVMTVFWCINLIKSSEPNTSDGKSGSARLPIAYRVGVASQRLGLGNYGTLVVVDFAFG
jgi:hypothetical protein